MASDVSNGRKSSPAASRKPNFCEFSEPYTVELEEVFNNTVKKSFQIPCSDLEGSLGNRNKRDMCEVFRYGLTLYNISKF
jgi:hypothetical protein